MHLSPLVSSDLIIVSGLSFSLIIKGIISCHSASRICLCGFNYTRSPWRYESSWSHMEGFCILQRIRLNFFFSLWFASILIAICFTAAGEVMSQFNLVICQDTSPCAQYISADWSHYIHFFHSRPWHPWPFHRTHFTQSCIPHSRCAPRWAFHSCVRRRLH